ncbi:PDC1, partial [Symbiodinium pilosum]
LAEERERHRENEEDLQKRLNWATQRLHDWQSGGSSPRGAGGRKCRWGKEEEDRNTSSPDSAMASTKTGSPAEVGQLNWEERLRQLKQNVKDILRQEVRAFAESWSMPFDQVEGIFERLTSEQKKLVMRRFKAQSHKGSPIALLRSVLCTTAFAGGGVDRPLPKQPLDNLRDLEEEQLSIVTQRFHYDARTANQSNVSAQLRTYVSSCRHRGFWAEDRKTAFCKTFAGRWQLPTGAVWDAMEPLSVEQCEQLSTSFKPDDGAYPSGKGGWRGWH